VVEREESVRFGVRAQLREVIAASGAGQRLPSERDLSSRWGVARMTLRHAMDDLVLEGLVERRHGSGTYVAPQPFARFLGLTSFTQDMRERGLVPGSRLLEYRAVPAEEPIAAQLGVPLGEPLVRFTRVRLGSGDPMALETVWIPNAFVPGLNRADLGGSLYEVLARRYQIVAASASVTVEPVVPDDRTCDLLGISSGQACLRLRMVDSDTGGRVVMCADCIYRGDRYQLSATLAGADFSSLQARRAG
jgi:DNA-binding GntR family transcriptional regulator